MSRSARTAVFASAAAVALFATTVPAGGHEGDEERGRGPRDREHHERARQGREAASRGERGAPGAAIDPTYAKECGSCHVAFPPHLLPAASWTKLMDALDRHFGENAELDAEAQAAIERWLLARAGGARAGKTPLRVTETDPFHREHQKVSGAAVRPSIRSMANCAACHPGAERWDFEEDRVKIPRG
jgi:hypothetical protein